MINFAVINEPVFRPYSSFEAAVQGTCDEFRGMPCTHANVRALEARLDSIAHAAVRHGELLNERPPRAMVRSYQNPRGFGVELSIIWSERPILGSVLPNGDSTDPRP